MEDDEDQQPERILFAIGVATASVIFLYTVTLHLDLAWPDFSFEAERKRVALRPMRPPQPQPVPDDARPSASVEYTAIAMRRGDHRSEALERVEIVRGADWLREQRVRENYTEVAFTRAHARVTWLRDQGGADHSLSASQGDDSMRGESPMVSRNTGRTAVVLGERCTIWESDYADERLRRDWSRSTSCITSDGITMWWRSRDYQGQEHVNSQLISLQRREVSEEEVAPPARLFQWEIWREQAPPAPAHNLRIESESESHRGGPIGDSESILERGDWRYRYAMDGPQRSWDLSTTNLLFRYSEVRVALRSSRHLRIARGSQAPRPTVEPGPLFDPPRREFIAWRWCRWFHMPSPSHSSASACITEDGLTLAHNSAGDGVRGGNWSFSVRATQVSRDPLPASAFEPPARAFDWLD